MLRIPNRKAIVTWGPFLSVCGLLALSVLAGVLTMFLVFQSLFHSLAERSQIRDRQLCEQAAADRQAEPLVKLVDPKSASAIDKFLRDIDRYDPQCHVRPNHAPAPTMTPQVRRHGKRFVIVPSPGEPPITIPRRGPTTVIVTRRPRPSPTPSPSREPSPPPSHHPTRHPTPHPSTCVSASTVVSVCLKHP